MAREILFEEIDGETIALDLDQGEYWGLNQSATEIWKLACLGKSELEIVQDLSNTYDDQINELLPVIQRFMVNLKAAGFLVPKS